MRKFPISLVISLLLYSFISSELPLQVQVKGQHGISQKDNVSVSPCADALSQRSVCTAANRRALDIMSANRLEAITVIQDVRTGAVLVYAASQPSDLDVTTLVRPLSLAKLFLAASWWDHRQPDASFDRSQQAADARNPSERARVSIPEMLVNGSDNAGRQMAVALRRSVGTKAVLEDFNRYGFGPQTNSPRDGWFWGELSQTWKARLTPGPAYVSLSNETNDTDWAEAISLGETKWSVTALHVSRFLQAVGNDGVMLKPAAREEQSTPLINKSRRQLKNSTRIMELDTARRLQSAMLDCIRRGTAKSIAHALEDTGWQIGGKTGSGPALLPKGAQLDGWFAGLIFDPQGKAGFTVATFVRSGGYGGGNAAKISAELARYIIGAPGKLLPTAAGRGQSPENFAGLIK